MVVGASVVVGACVVVGAAVVVVAGRSVVVGRAVVLGAEVVTVVLTTLLVELVVESAGVEEFPRRTRNSTSITTTTSKTMMPTAHPGTPPLGAFLLASGAGCPG